MQIFVNLHHRDIQDGTRERPFGTISQAAAIASPGDEIIVFPGIYRECVRPALGGTDEANRITYRSFLPRGAVISGAELLTNWESRGGNVYAARVPDTLFENAHPFAESCPKAFFHPGGVFRNSSALLEADSPDTLAQTRNSWFAAREQDGTYIHVNLSGLDPNREQMEVSVRPSCFSPASPDAGFITLSGFRLEKAASSEEADAPKGVLCSGSVQGWIIEDCEIRYGIACGISIGENDESSQEPMTILGCDIHDCETAGIWENETCIPVRVGNCQIHHIGLRRPNDDAAGVRLLTSPSVQISGCHIHHCTVGLSLGPEIQSLRITGNALHHNGPSPASRQDGADLSFVTGGMVQISRNLFLSDHSCRAVSSSRGTEKESAFRGNLLNGSIQEAAGEIPASSNICFEHADGPCSVQCGAECIPLPDARSEVLGGEGCWVLRTNLYRLMPEETGADGSSLPENETDYFGQPYSHPLPGPFADGTPGAWILGTRDLP